VKDQILTVEPHDDLASLRDKILRTQAERILLLPASSPNLRRLDLALCARWADAVGASLCLVSSEVNLTRTASQAGIASYPTLDEALAAEKPTPETVAHVPQPRQSNAWVAGEIKRDVERLSTRPFTADLVAMRKLRGRIEADEERQTTSRPIGRRVQGALFLAPLALLATSALLLIPHADVDVALPSHASLRTVAIDASSASSMAAEAVADGAMFSTGSAVVPTTFAEGELSLANHSSRVVAIPPGTRFRDPTSGMDFEALSGGWLDPQASALVGIRAVEPGPQSNLPPGRIREVVGPAHDTLEVRQLSSTSGGQSAARAIVSAADIASVRSQTQALIAQRIREALERETSVQGWMIVEGSILIRSQEESFSASAGTAVDEVHMTIKAKAESLVVPQEVLLHRARQVLGITDDTGGPKWAELRVEQDSQGALHILFSLQEFESSIPPDLAGRLANRTPAGAQRVIAGQLPNSRTTIHLAPAWWPLLPAFPIRIHIQRLAAGESPLAPPAVAGGAP
jgi:hypothetical protein